MDMDGWMGSRGARGWESVHTRGSWRPPVHPHFTTVVFAPETPRTGRSLVMGCRTCLPRSTGGQSWAFAPETPTLPWFFGSAEALHLTPAGFLLVSQATSRLCSFRGCLFVPPFVQYICHSAPPLPFGAGQFPALATPTLQTWQPFPLGHPTLQSLLVSWERIGDAR